MAVKARGQVTLAVAVDVSSVTRWYLLQASTLTPPAKPTTATPSSSWTTTEPTYSEGSTSSLYTCDRTTLSDGSFAWSDVSLSSSYEAAKAAYNKATAASTIATAIKSFFFHDTAGAHVATTADSPDTGFNALWTATRLAFRNAATELMTISADLIELGKNSTSAVISMCSDKLRIAYEAYHGSSATMAATISSDSYLWTKSGKGSEVAYDHVVTAEDISTLSNNGTSAGMLPTEGNELLSRFRANDATGTLNRSTAYLEAQSIPADKSSMYEAGIGVTSGYKDASGTSHAPMFYVYGNDSSNDFNAYVPISSLTYAVSRTVLWTGKTSGDITLSVYLPSYSMIQIIGSANDNAYYSPIWIPSPTAGAIVDISGSRCGSWGWGMSRGRWTLTSTGLSASSGNNGSVSGNSGGFVWDASDAAKVYIRQVIGWR